MIVKDPISGDPITDPHQVAEFSLVADMLHGDDEADTAMLRVREDDFVNHTARLIAGTVFKIRRGGGSVSLETVWEKTIGDGTAKDLGDNPAAYIGGLFENLSPTSANLEYLAGLVAQAAQMRTIRATLLENARDSSPAFGPAADLVARVQRQLEEIVGGRDPREPREARDLLPAALNRYDANRTGAARPVGVPTPFEDLNRLIGGFRPGSLITVAARPSIGKSALAFLLAVHAAKLGFPTLIHSLEMAEADCLDRLVAMTANVPLPRLLGQGRLEPDHVRRVLEQQRTGIGSLPLWIDDRCSLNATQVCTIARRHVRRKGVKLVVIDYLQLLRAENPRDPRHLQVGTSVKRLKELARETGTSVVMLAQLNRQPEERGNGRPRLSDLRESGDIEQDSDLVFLLHRLDDDPAKTTHDVDLIVAKNRNGPIGDIPLSYQRVYTRFESRQPAY